MPGHGIMQTATACTLPSCTQSTSNLQRWPGGRRRYLAAVRLIQHRKHRKEQGEEPVLGGRLVDDPQVAEAGLSRHSIEGSWRR